MRCLARTRSSHPGACVPRDLNPHVSEGGLEPPRRCCITDSVMYHHSKLARRRRPARQFAMGASGSWRFSLPGPESWEVGRVYCAFMSLRSARMYG